MVTGSWSSGVTDTDVLREVIFLPCIMKVRIANDLPSVPLGTLALLGKELVSLEDNVGFTVYEFRLIPGDDFAFTAFSPDHNHIYYCIEGQLLIFKLCKRKTILFGSGANHE